MKLENKTERFKRIQKRIKFLQLQDSYNATCTGFPCEMMYKIYRKIAEQEEQITILEAKLSENN